MAHQKKRGRETTDIEPAIVKALRQENAELREERARPRDEIERLKLTMTKVEAGCQTPQEKEKEVKLPTEVWVIIAKKLDKNDVCSFALVSKQLREAQVLAGRKLVTRPDYWKEDVGLTILNLDYFTEDWCAYWSRKFNVHHTDPELIKHVLYIAARYGYLEVFEKYWSQGPQEKLSKVWDEDTCGWAAQGGHLEVMKWLRAKGCPWNEETSIDAAFGGHLEVLQWMRAQDPPCPWNSDVCLDAAEQGHLDVLRWVRSQGCPWDERVPYAAAEGGHLEVLQWSRTQDPPCPWNSDVCSFAAKKGHLEILRWARSQGCPWDEEVSWAAANNGHLEVLRWARSQGCPWDGRAPRAAALWGHLKVLKWLIKEGCPYSKRKCRMAAARGEERARKVLEWLDDE